MRARPFAEAVGRLAETDRLDARVLALMGQALEPSAIARARSDRSVAGIGARTGGGQSRGNCAVEPTRRQPDRRSQSRTRPAAENLGRPHRTPRRRDPALKRRYDIVVTIPDVGPVALVIGLPELGGCSAKAAALLAGLAPLACDSGEKAGERHIKGRRAFVRTGLYLAAIAAARFNPQLSDDYKRLRSAGKKAKVAITAIMRKLVVLANVLIKEDRPWKPIQA